MNMALGTLTSEGMVDLKSHYRICSSLLWSHIKVDTFRDTKLLYKYSKYKKSTTMKKQTTTLESSPLCSYYWIKTMVSNCRCVFSAVTCPGLVRIQLNNVLYYSYTVPDI